MDTGQISAWKDGPAGTHHRIAKADSSPRWKQIAEPYPGRFIHHLELYETNEIDDEIRALLTEAWGHAGQATRIVP